MPPFAAFLSRFSAAPRLYLQTAAGVREPRGNRGRRYWVVSRGLCRFFKVPLLADAAAADQRDALRLELDRLSPYVDTGSHIDISGDFASLWLWDQEAVAAAAEAIGIEVERVVVLPETALLPKAAEGVRLVATLDGVEGQCWSGGGLAASRWWPAPPDDRAWVLFQRGASVAPDQLATTAPAPVQLDWLDRPWTREHAGGALDLGRLDLRLVIGAALGLVVLGYAYLGAEWLRLAYDIHGLRSVIAAHDKAIRPVLDARATALENLAAIRMLNGLDGYPSQLAVMAHVAEILPKVATRFTEWSYDHGQLAVTVASNHPLDALFFVRSLQRIDGFSNVAVERAENDNSLRIRLTIDHK